MRSVIAATIACGLCLIPRPVLADARHPLDPLTQDELAVVGEVLKASDRFSAGTNFAWLQLEEPAKALVQAYAPGDEFPRRASLCAIDYAKRKNFAVVVDIKRRRVESITDLGLLQPGLDGRDLEIAREAVDADPAIARALERRGLRISGRISKSVHLLYTALGRDPGLSAADGRLVRILFSADQRSLNHYGPIVDGLMAVVDVYAGRVVRLMDSAGTTPPRVAHDVFDPAIVGRNAPLPKPPSSAAGRRFRVEGNTLSWAGWNLRFGFNLREGLVLYQIAINEEGVRHPVAYRVSVSEIATAYADPSPQWSWLEILDESTFGLGSNSLAVRPGREVPGSAQTLSPMLPAPDAPRFGAPQRDRLYVYERDAGNLYYYEQDGRVAHRRGRELVFGWYVWLGNYIYGLNWVFREDGSFGFEVELAGLILTRIADASAARESPEHGRALPAGLVGIHHQHWFNLRLDFDILGERNAVAENDVARGEGRYFSVTHTDLATSGGARRSAQDETARTWTVYNPHARGVTGQPRGYSVVPGGNTSTVFPRTQETGPVGFTFHHLWVTPYREGQLYAAGTYPYQAGSGYADTLFHYSNGESVHDRDLVIWYSLGETHVTRPEDWPVMTNAKLSVSFRPEGFFTRNHAILRPRPQAALPRGEK